MILGVLAFIISFLSGSLGVLNIIGSGFVFIFVNTIMKLSNGQDLQWRIHLANFFISFIYVVFSYNRVFRHIYYLFGTLVVVVASWGLGKILLYYYNFSSFKLLALVIMIILALLNVQKSEAIVEVNEELTGVSMFRADDFFILSFCSFFSSYFEINFGAISCLVLITVKKKIRLLDLSNIVYFSMLLYSILNFAWYSIKKEIYFDKDLEIYIFLGLVLGAMFSMTFKNKLQERMLSKIILISIFLYLIILFFNKAFI